MSEAPPDWDSFFDLTTSAEAAVLLRAEHAANALQAAENCGDRVVTCETERMDQYRAVWRDATPAARISLNGWPPAAGLFRIGNANVKSSERSANTRRPPEAASGPESSLCLGNAEGELERARGNLSQTLGTGELHP